MKKIDLTGKTFGKLTVLQEIAERRNGRVLWQCRCECGNLTVSRGCDLRKGDTRTCGCSRLEGTVTHGLVHHELYNTWRKIKERCYNPNAVNYGRYGAVGIRMYEPWRNDVGAFIRYLEKHLGPRPKGCSLDRIDTLRGYEPENLRWATAKQQARNSRKNLPACIKYGSPLHTQFSHWKYRNELSEEWMGGYGIDWNKIIEDVGEPPMENSRLIRIDKKALVGRENVVWEVAYSQ